MLGGGESGHLARYITTLGVGIIAGTLSLAALFMRQKTELLISTSELEDLPEPAREAVLSRQQDIAFIATNYGELVVAGLVLGLAVFALGLVLWIPKQRRSDEREASDAELAELNVRARRLDLQSALVESDAALAVGVELTASGYVTSSADTKRDVERKDARVEAPTAVGRVGDAAISEAIHKTFALEDELSQKLQRAFDSTHIVDPAGGNLGPRRDGRIWRPDFALLPFEPDDPVYAVELKYAARGRVLGQVVSTGAEQLRDVAKGTENAPFTPVLIVIVADGVPLAQFLKAQSLWENDGRPGHLRIFILREDEFRALTPSRLRGMITSGVA